MAFQPQNFYEDTLSAPIGSNDLIIPINNPPSVSEGWLLIDWDIPGLREFVYFTGRTATTVTLSTISARGVDGTSARTHSSGAKVRINVNAAMLAGLRDGTALNNVPGSVLAPSSVTVDKTAKPYASIFSNATQDVPSTDGSNIQVTMTGTDYNIGMGISNSNITANSAGIYLVMATVENTDTINFGAFLRRNSAIYRRLSFRGTQSGQNGYQAGNVTALVQMSVGDTISIWYQNRSLATSITFASLQAVQIA